MKSALQKENPNTGTNLRLLIAEIQGVSPATRALIRKQDNALQDFERGLKKAIPHLSREKLLRFKRGHFEFCISQSILTAKCDVELPATHQIKIERLLHKSGLTIQESDSEQSVWIATKEVN